MTDNRISKLEGQVETLLNAIVEMVRVHTGKSPVAAEIRRDFLERGELPTFASEQPKTIDKA